MLPFLGWKPLSARLIPVLIYPDEVILFGELVILGESKRLAFSCRRPDAAKQVSSPRLFSETIKKQNISNYIPTLDIFGMGSVLTLHSRNVPALNRL